MIRYQLTMRAGQKVEITLAVAEPEDYGRLQFTGEPAAVSDAEWALYGASGIDGHLIREETTPVDLAAAMGDPAMRALFPKRLAGDEILSRYVRRPPRHG